MKTTLSALLMFLMSASAQGAAVPARVVCNGLKPRVVFMLAEESSVRYEKGLLSVSGTAVEINGTDKISADECKSGYHKQYKVYPECPEFDCGTITKTKFIERDWNALVIRQRPSALTLACAGGSSIEIYQDRALFAGDFLESSGKVGAFKPTGVTARGCYSDRF